MSEHVTVRFDRVYFLEAAPFFAFLGDFLALTTLGFFGEAAFDFLELFSLVTLGLTVLAGFAGLAVLAGFSVAGAGFNQIR